MSTADINRAVMEAQEHAEESHDGMVSGMSDRLGYMKENLANMSSSARDAAAQRLGEARDMADQYYHQGRRQAMMMGHNVESQIQTRPIAAIAVAAGLGFLAGLCLMRRS